jgi:hypothetical protein
VTAPRQEKKTRGARNVDLLKRQWALSLAAELREVADDLPEGHQERPGLMRAVEFVRCYGAEGSR